MLSFNIIGVLLKDKLFKWDLENHLVLSNDLIKVKLPLRKIWKADVSSISTSSEPKKRGEHLKCQLSKSFTVVIQPLSTPLIKPNFHVSIPHWCSTRVSLETRHWETLSCCLKLYPLLLPMYSIIREWENITVRRIMYVVSLSFIQHFKASLEDSLPFSILL